MNLNPQKKKYVLKLGTLNWPKFVCFYRGNFSQIVAFEIIFCHVIWTGGLAWWTASWWLNGQLIYSCTIPPHSYPTNLTHDHRDTHEFNSNRLFFWIGIEFYIPAFEDLRSNGGWWWRRCTHVQSLWENQISGRLIYKCVCLFVKSWCNTVYLILKHILIDCLS